MFDENSNTAGAGAVVAQSGALAPGSIPGNVSAPNSAIVTQLLNVKDSRWLQVEVCREFQRGQCARSDLECKFAHPPPHVDVQQGRVTACYDSIKNRNAKRAGLIFTKRRRLGERTTTTATNTNTTSPLPIPPPPTPEIRKN
ncbi:unnamed protein product [Nippostrongylus brasiliensis]|uniref:Muscleblind-like protein (inferred by orthology to a C. elegans protein) n=1 Tax=Nippostrongylus brasiliensis TaxID=27835 RepID=A0A0N4XWG0_NIPBR|nr:unnamed protein product [Nippostrongylus brasiliensis]